MLRLGASTEMVGRFYGLTHQEVALRRDILGLPKRKGRHPVLDEEQDTALWKQWRVFAEARSIACDDDARSEEHTSQLQSLMRISYAVFCLKKKTDTKV